MKSKDEKRCGLYIRVSSERQAKTPEGSLDTQEYRLRQALTVKADAAHWTVVDVYREEGWSGKHTDRPQLQRLLRDIRAGAINFVLVVKLDRLTRSLMDFYTLNQVFQEYHVGFHIIDESFDTSTATGQAMLDITLVFAELERKRTAERTAEAAKVRAEKGFMSGRVFGYDLNPSNPLLRVINEKDAELVRLVFRTHVEKGSIRETTNAINEAGYRTKDYVSKEGRPHGGRRFAPQVIHKMLVNRHYLGEVRNNEDWYPGLQEPIVDRRLFERVQALLADNKEDRLNTTSPRKHTFLLQGILQCGPCGGQMAIGSGTGKSGRAFYHYVCKSRDEASGKHICPVRSVPAKRIEQAVLREIARLAQDPTGVEGAVRSANERLEDQGEPLAAEKRALEAKLREIEDRGKAWAKQILDGDLKADRYIQQTMKDLAEQEDQVRIEIAKVADKLRHLRDGLVEAKVVKEALATFEETFGSLPAHEQRRAVLMLVNRVTYRPDRLEIELYEGRTLLVELEPKRGGGGRNGSGGDDEGGGGKGRKKRTPNAPFTKGSLGVRVSSLVVPRHGLQDWTGPPILCFTDL